MSGTQSQVSSLSTGAGEDAVVLDIAARFVQDIIDRARTEAAAKLNQETLVTLVAISGQQSVLINFNINKFGKSPKKYISNC